MKNILLILVFTIMMAGIKSEALYGQQFYVGLNAGYGLKIPSGVHNNMYTSNTTINTTTFSEKINFSLGQGLNIGLTGGCTISKNAFAELNVSYLNGDPVNAKYTSTDTSSNYYFNENCSLKAKMLFLNPALQLSMSSDRQLDPYIRFGIIFGIGKVYENNDMIISGSYYEKSFVYQGGNALGVSSALGVMYKANELMSMFCEVRMNAVSYSPGRGEMTEFTQDGVDRLSTQTLHDKEFVFVDSYTLDQSAPVDLTKPSETLKDYLALNSFGFHFGLKFNL